MSFIIFKKIKKYNVSVIDTKVGTSTGARLQYIKKMITAGENFFSHLWEIH